MRARVIVGLAAAGALMAGLAQAEAPAKGRAAARADGKAAFERLKTLAGEWRGHVVTADGPPAEVVYGVTAGGSTVTERLFPGTEHEMMTMYHLDGGDLVLTHYCGMGNQPRMRLAPSADPAELRFDFTGGANIDPAKDMHMHAGRIVFKGADAIETEWDVHDKGKRTGSHKFFMTRAAAR